MPRKNRPTELSAPDTAKGQLQRELLRRINNYRDEGLLPTNGRFLFYELVKDGILSKEQPRRYDGKVSRKPSDNLSDALIHLRDCGLVGWDDIEDETRRLEQWQTADTVADYVTESLDYATIDRWAGKPAPLILCESRSLSGTLRGIASRYACPLASTNGQARGFLVTKVAPTLMPGQRVLYLGDLDYCGGDIESNNLKTLIEYSDGWADGEILWERVALTEAQVIENSLPVISKPDKRFKPMQYFDAVETEALGQRLLMDLLTDRLDELMPESIEDVLARQERQRDIVAEQLRTIDLG